MNQFTASQMARQEMVPRRVVAALLVVASLTAGLLFQGTSVNLVVLAMASAASLASLVCVWSSGVSEAFARNRYGFAMSLGMLGYLTVAYRLSVSPDSSFAASWVLAAGPLTFICASAIALRPRPKRLLQGSVTALVVALAALSAFRFVFFGERAHQPLVDPNNYAALMYLIWIPLVHRHLTDGWRGLQPSPLQHCLVFASSFVLMLALIATRSRTSLVVVGVAVLIWLGLAIYRREAANRLLVHVGVVVLAWGVSVAATALTDAPQKGLGFGGGLSIRGELIRSKSGSAIVAYFY